MPANGARTDPAGQRNGYGQPADQARDAHTSTTTTTVARLAPGATSLHTAKPWAGGAGLVVTMGALGGALAGLGGPVRRRWRAQP
jgi:hypothetical protein